MSLRQASNFSFNCYMTIYGLNAGGNYAIGKGAMCFFLQPCNINGINEIVARRINAIPMHLAVELQNVPIESCYPNSFDPQGNDRYACGCTV